jgi:D-3-phosphoglycerate dehydrogenase / 2-oxoglutarate reductase
MAPKVLIADKLSEKAVAVFEQRGIDFDIKTGLDKQQILEVIGLYDGLVVRSSTKVTEPVIAAAQKLKVIGRAGVGVDTIDVNAATAKGIIIMNTPFGNSITTAEHAISLMLALARKIPAADQSTQAGNWNRNGFMGVEVTAKTLGIIGCGNIGTIVADRALGLRMKVIAFDPFLSAERSVELGVEKVDLDTLLARSDFISLHTPLTDKTRNIIDAVALDKMKPGVRIINCARGGLIVDEALKAALGAGHVAGVALDVYAEEPPKDHILFGMDNVICTPHLGASTSEAQVNVAIQVAEQVSDYLLDGAVSNAINMPSISSDEATKLQPYVKLVQQLGLFAGQLTETGLCRIKLEYAGEVADMNTKALTATALAGVLQPLLENVNLVNAPVVAKQRGIETEEVTRPSHGAYETYVRLTVTTDRQERSVAGTVFRDGKPRVIQVKGINMEAELGPHMLYITNNDKPGFIGSLGATLGDAGVNIATFHLGRLERGGDAIALIEVDEEVPLKVLEAVANLAHVTQVKTLAF